MFAQVMVITVDYFCMHQYHSLITLTVKITLNLGWFEVEVQL